MRLESRPPSALGYRMPAEWEPHESTWLAWPKNPLTFPEGILEKVEWTYVRMISSLLVGERVDLLVDSPTVEARVGRLLDSTANVKFHEIRTADVWMRDYGPIFVKNSDVAATKWRFNAWGNKYEDLLPDDLSGMQVATATGLKVYEPGVVLEGGSLDVNGRGMCLTTEQCLLNPNRNPGLRRLDLERLLADYLGVKHTVWLGRGIAGDDTDGHIDEIARFATDRVVLCSVATDPADENYDALSEDLRLLKEAGSQEGDGFEVVAIPLPERKIGADNRLPASYANFYIGNSAVIVPRFDDPNDAEALSIISSLFPSREVVGVNSEALVYGFGGIHCITQQQPRAGA